MKAFESQALQPHFERRNLSESHHCLISSLLVGWAFEGFVHISIALRKP